MNAKVISSPANQTIKDIKALEMRKRRKETGLFRAEGLRTIIEGMELNAELKIVAYLTDLRDRPDIIKVRDYCLSCGGEALEVTEAVLEKSSHKDNPQAVIGVFKQTFKDLSEIDPSRATCWVVLEEVRDPGNLGTIMRTIDGVGADGVILVGNCCDPYSIEAVRATMGSIFVMPIATATREEYLEWAKDWPGQKIGTTLQDSVDYREVTYTPPILLVMGNEQAGLTGPMRIACSHIVRLPMNGRADSLNLSIATGIMLYKMLED